MLSNGIELTFFGFLQSENERLFGNVASIINSLPPSVFRFSGM